MKWSLSWFALLAACSASVGGTRALAASWVPKLDLRCQLSRTRHRDEAIFAGADGSRAHMQIGVGGFLRWQPTVYAAHVPARYELSPSAFLAPCEADDSSCFAEFAEDEREIGQALQEAP